MTTAVFARVQRVCSLFILFTSLACLPACGAVISLAAGGRPMAVIVVAPDAHPRLMLAADELQHYVERICGVTLPISTTGEKAQETGLYIGNCAPTQESDLPTAGMNPETYAVTVRDGDIYFTGRHPTPTYFAVASFIEDDLGVRWFAPGPDWEYVPEGTPGNLAVNVRSRVVVPDTSPRIWSGHAWNPNWSTWNLRNKTVLSEVVPRRQFQNYLHRIFTVEKYGESNPEFFPLINGVRYLPVNDNNWRPCESNPEVQRITVEYARRFFDENPNIDSFSLGMDDIYRMCSCENCRAMDAHPDSYERQQFSDRHYKFVNAVAREIAKTHPDRYIGTLIYHIARDLPETVDRLEDNVFGFITETSAQWWEPGRKAADMALTREWAKRCRHLSRYDYYGMGGITPRVYPHAMAEQIKFDKSLGLEGMYIEVYTFLPNTAPMIYALSKLQWDASLDVDRLLGEFYARMFGPAAGTMKEYFDLLERSWNTPRPGRRGWVHRNLVTQALAMSAEDVDEGMRLLHRALRQADDELTKKRIRTVQAGLRYGGYAIHTYALSEKLRTMPIRTEADAREILDGFEALVRLGIERERYWQAAWRRDDLLGETVRGLGGMGYLAVNQVPRLEVGANSAALRVVSWYENNAPDKLPEMVNPDTGRVHTSYRHRGQRHRGLAVGAKAQSAEPACQPEL